MFDASDTNLLVIENDGATRSGVKRLFEMSGYRVTAVADEREAAEINVAQHLPDLILFNTNLPPPASLISAYKIYQRPEFDKTPMLVISVHNHSIDFINKPEADDFTVAYLAEVSRFDELEHLVDCLRSFKK